MFLLLIMSDILLEKIPPKHQVYVEENPQFFLETKLTYKDGLCKTRVFRKPNKVPLHWFSKTPIRYKRNAITGDLYRAKRISSYFEDEIPTIRTKFITAGFPQKFVESVIGNFINPKPVEDEEDLPLIPPYFFDSPPSFYFN